MLNNSFQVLSELEDSDVYEEKEAFVSATEVARYDSAAMLDTCDLDSLKSAPMTTGAEQVVNSRYGSTCVVCDSDDDGTMPCYGCAVPIHASCFAEMASKMGRKQGGPCPNCFTDPMIECKYDPLDHLSPSDADEEFVDHTQYHVTEDTRGNCDFLLTAECVVKPRDKSEKKRGASPTKAIKKWPKKKSKRTPSSSSKKTSSDNETIGLPPPASNPAVGTASAEQSYTDEKQISLESKKINLKFLQRDLDRLENSNYHNIESFASSIGCTVALNPNAFLFTYDSKNVNMVSANSDYSVYNIDKSNVVFTSIDGGIDAKFSVVGTYATWDRKSIVRRVSSCLCFLLVQSHDSETDPSTQGSFHPLPEYTLGQLFGVGVDVRVEFSCQSVIPRIGDTKGTDLPRLFNLAMTHYKRFYAVYPSLDFHVATVLASDAFWDAVEKFYDDLAERWKHRHKTELLSQASDRGYTAEEIEEIYQRYRKWATIKQVAVKTMCAAVPVVGWAAGAYFFSKGFFKGVAGRRREAIQGVADYLSPGGPPISIMTCNTIDIEKFSGSDRPYPEQWSEMVLEPPEPPSPTERKEFLQVYGATMPIPVAIPVNDNRNLYDALRHRVVFDRPVKKDNQELVESFIAASKATIDKMPDFEVDYEGNREHLRSTYGVKKGDRLYAMAEEPLDYKDTNSELFVKAEPYFKTDPKSRMIWNRSERMLGHFSVIFKKLARQMKAYWNERGHMKYVSGDTPDSMGSYVEYADIFPFHFMSDVSSWDGSLQDYILGLELYFLENKVHGISEGDMQFLKDNWFRIRGCSKDRRVRVSGHHGRRSGDLWTSLFNSMINWLIHLWAYDLKVGHYALMILGDDSTVSIAEKPDMNLVKKKYEALGMTVDIIECEEARWFEFCSGYFYPVDGRLRWGVKPFKVLAKLGMNFGKHDPKLYKSLLYGTATSLLPIAGHVPIVGAVCRAITRTAKEAGIKMRKDNRFENPYRPGGGVVLTPGPDTFSWFADKYGISEKRLREIDSWLEARLHINDFPLYLDDPIFTDGAGVDLGVERFDDPRTVIVPRQSQEYIEEVDKLRGVNSLFGAIRSGWRAGEVENRLAASKGIHIDHRAHHAVFSAVSYLKLDYGVALHRKYNEWVRSRRPDVFRSPPIECNKKKLQNTKKPKKRMTVKKGGKGSAALRKLAKVAKQVAGAAIEAGKHKAMEGLVSVLSGVGDYTSAGAVIGGVTPTFQGNNGEMVLTFSEYLGPIYSSTVFTTRRLYLNVGDANTFPFASSIALNFTLADILECVFMYKSLSATALNSTNTALGSVMMAVQYDADEAPFGAKLQMMNHYFATESVPSRDMIMAVECKNSFEPLHARYVSPGPDGSDPRFSNLGVLTIATQDSQAASNIGDLWVSYKIKFMLPKLSIGPRISGIYHRWRGDGTTGFSTTNFPGEACLHGGNVDVINAANGITFPYLPAGRYYMTLNIRNYLTVAGFSAVFSLGAKLATSGWRFNSDSWGNTSSSGNTTYANDFVFDCDGSPTSQVIFSFTASGTQGGTPYFDIYLFSGPPPDGWPVAASGSLSSLSSQQHSLIAEAERRNKRVRIRDLAQELDDTRRIQSLIGNQSLYTSEDEKADIELLRSFTLM